MKYIDKNSQFNPKLLYSKGRDNQIQRRMKFKLATDPIQQIGYKTGRRNHEFSNLIPNTKYKLLIEITNNKIAGGNGAFERIYYDITGFATPFGFSKFQNHRGTTGLTGVWSSLRSSKKLWGYDHFKSNESGELRVKIFHHAHFKLGINRCNVWNSSWVDDWKENAKHNIIAVPHSHVVVGSNGTCTIQPNVVAPPPPVVCGPGPIFIDDCYQDLGSDYIQTFVIDPNAVKNSKTVDVTDVSIFVRGKPGKTNNISGIVNPGLLLSIHEVEKGVPQVSKQILNSLVRVPYTSIIASSDATVPTTFYFSDPVRLRVGKKYAFSILIEDEGYNLWSCKTGDRLVGTNTASTGAPKGFKGDLYRATNAPTTLKNATFEQLYQKKDDTDLKFEIGVAEYSIGADIVVTATNKDEEFLTISNASGDFIGTEHVYVNAANATGTVSISGGETTLIGSGTTFTSLVEDETIVLIDNTDTTKVEVAKITLVVSDTEVILQEPVLNDISGNYIQTMTAEVESYFPGNNRLVLTNSTANTTNYLTTSSVLVGVDSGETANVGSIENVSVSAFETDLDLDLPSTFKVSGIYNFANSASSMSTENNVLDLYGPNYIRNYDAYVLSRSNEIVNLAGAKSANIQITFDYTGPFSATSFDAPILNVDDFTFSTSRWLINNNTTNEHTNYGSALTRHISKPLTFREGGSAEDIRVIYNAWRPNGTDVKCYAKIINSEDPDNFDDKSWTLLEMKRGSGEFGSKDNPNDFREYEFGFPSYPPSSDTLGGTITTTDANTTVTGVGTEFANTSTGLSAGDIIKIYNPLFPDTNYGIFSVNTVTNDLQIVLNTAVTDANITGSGFKIDRLSTPHTAFNNSDNLNIVRYFSPDGVSYDTYSTVVIKTVLTSSSGQLVPKVNDFRVIGVSS